MPVHMTRPTEAELLKSYNLPALNEFMYDHSALTTEQRQELQLARAIEDMEIATTGWGYVPAFVAAICMLIIIDPRSRVGADIAGRISQACAWWIIVVAIFFTENWAVCCLMIGGASFFQPFLFLHPDRTWLQKFDSYLTWIFLPLGVILSRCSFSIREDPIFYWVIETFFMP